VTYRLFYSVESIPSDSDQRRSKSLEFDSMSATICAGCELLNSGGTVWRIESPSGFVMERSDIENECIRRSSIQKQSGTDFSQGVSTLSMQ
jgi:hypothetical protein